jgi:hypothetical protein
MNCPPQPMRIIHPTVLCLVIASLPAGAATVDFDRDVRPILSDRCFPCHGPDARQREAKLRLDLPPDQLAEVARNNLLDLLNPGKPEQSEFLNRIHTDDPDELMPPADSGLVLSATEKETLRQWVAGGAAYTMLWSFVTPTLPTLPEVKNADWCRNEIDRFVLAKLEAANRQPSPPADRRTLIRRLTFDLTGLPPTPAEIHAFLADPSPQATETLIDRLLKSERFGERQAADWMDAARYADTSGYQYDWPRTMWRWRSWVIDAFNRDLPYNLFIQWQIAGDLLPNAHSAQVVATGFNRNHGFTIESGTIDEEYRVQYVTDRVTTMGTAFLGLTLECARCHDHKYDPLSQKDFYRLFAFFNRVNEAGVVPGKPSFAAPAIPTPTPEQIRRVQELSKHIAELAKKLHQSDPEADRKQRTWARALRTTWKTKDGRPAQSFDFELLTGAHEHLSVTVPHPDAQPVTAVRLAITPTPMVLAKGDVNFELIGVRLWHRRPDGTRHREEVARLESSVSLGENLAGLLVDEVPGTAWIIDYGKPTTLVIGLVEPVSENGELQVELEVESPLAVNLRIAGTVSRIGSPLRHDRTGRLAEYVAGAAGAAEAAGELRRAFRGNELPQYRETMDRLIGAERDVEDLRAAVAMTMVMRDEVDRETFVLERGAYDRKQERVEPGTPGRLPPMPAGAPPNRLGLAQWLTMAGNPLVPRVAVNRFWQQLFGIGLVRTPEDFGVQGDRPSHPRLLDWLAVDFAGRGWDVKGLVRMICLSATYQQASVATRRQTEWDPDNRQLARHSRRRLSAEMIRDNALAVAGLLAESVGGSSVMPYQPDGLWEQLTNRDRYQQKYVTATGADLYRRSLYTYWKRASHHPVMALFDAPSREICTVRRPVTNTPIQALALMNETLFVEAARMLATQMLTDLEFGRSDAERIGHAFERATSRVPEKLEKYALRQLLANERIGFMADPDAAVRLLKVGHSPQAEMLEPTELAAFTMVARAILNLSDTITNP